MASSDDDGRCALGTHPHTLPCLSVRVIAAGHCCERDGDHDGVTPREGPTLCWLWSGERFACSRLTETAQLFHCGHFFGITRCGGVRKSRSPDVDGLVVICSSELQAVLPSGLPLLLDWRSTIPAWLFCRSAGTRVPQRRGSLTAVTSTRRAVGVPAAWPSWCATLCRASACRCWHQLPGDHRLPRVPTGLPQHLRGEPLQPSMAMAHAAHFASTIRRSGHAAVICDLNLHRGLRDSHTPSTTEGVDLSSTLIDMDFGLANDPAQATRITHRNASFPDVAAYRVLRVTHWQSTPYMESDRCLISYSVGMDDGTPRLANTLP
ncbi:hypothetical protein TcBrA4_0110780 [Trypanosoma cruzi]|nr:hypothetical protein TcBrA4_0110780 [Trypanosoma cruzi]